MVKNLPAMGRPGFDPWVGKIPWRREWLPTPVFLPREFHGQRSLTSYSPWCCKESDTTERLTPSPCSKQANTFGSKVFCAPPTSAGERAAPQRKQWLTLEDF